MALSLTLHSRGKPSQAFTSGAARFIRLGTLATSSYRLDDPAAARAHAVIDLTAGGAVLRDLGSLHGTYVNGARIQTQALNNGDVIRIGETELSVTLQGVPEQLPQPTLARRDDATRVELTIAAPPTPHGSSPTLTPTGTVSLRIPAEHLPMVQAFLAHLEGRDEPALTPPQAPTIAAVQPPAPSDESDSFSEGYATYLDALQGSAALVDTTPVRPRAYVPPPGMEKYDTRRLVQTMRAERRKSRLLFAAGATVSLVLASLPIALPSPFGPHQMGLGRPLNTSAPATPSVSTSAPAAAVEVQAPTPSDIQEPAAQKTPPPPTAPEPNVPPTASAAAPTPSRPATYVVVPGDTLGTIAEKTLGHAVRWKELVTLNADVLPDPSRLEVGMRLRLPDAPQPTSRD